MIPTIQEERKEKLQRLVSERTFLRIRIEKFERRLDEINEEISILM